MLCPYFTHKFICFLFRHTKLKRKEEPAYGQPMPQILDAAAIELNFGACEEHGLESSPSEGNPGRGGGGGEHFHSIVIGMLVILFRV